MAEVVDEKIERMVGGASGEPRQGNGAERLTGGILRMARQMPILLLGFGLDGLVTFWNDECARVTGYDAVEAMANRDMAARLCPEGHDRQRLREILVTPEDDFHEREFSLKTKDGALKTIAWSNISRSFPVEGWASWVVGVDVSGRRAAETALRISEEKFHTLVDSAVEGINVAQEGRLCYLNKSMAAMLGYEPEELLGHGFHELIHPADLPIVLERHYSRLRGGSPPNVYPFRLVAKDNRVRWAELKTVIIDWEGRPATLNLMRDITDRRNIEQALRDGERRYQALADATFESVLIVERGRCVEANKTALAMFGYDHDQLLERDFCDLFADTACQEIRRFMQSGSAEPMEAEARRGDGGFFWAEVCCRQASYQGQAVTVCAVRDVTANKTAQIELRRSEATIRGILNAAPIAIGIMVGAERVLGWSNKMMSEMTGFSVEELEGMPASGLYPDSQEYERVGRLRRELLPATGLGSGETVWRRKDGALIDVLLSGALLNPDDMADGLVYTALDITQRKKTEQALKDNEERLRKIVEGLPLGAVLRDGDRLYANKAVEDITGWARADLATVADCFARIFVEEPERFAALYDKFRSSDGPSKMVVNITRRDGQRRAVEFSSSKEGENELWLLRDVTEETKAAEEKARLESQLRHAQKMEALGTLAGGIAHDFNNILAAIIGFTELAVEGHQEGQVNPADLKQVLRSAERARELVRQILAFSRQTEAELRPMDLNKQLGQTVELLKCTLPKMISVETILSGDAPLVLANNNQIEQLLLNLANNARDAMPEGGRLIFETESAMLDDEFCQHHVGLEPGAYVLLKVSDTGHGMDAKTLSRMYDPFFSTKEVGRGTGLGMSTVYGIVKGHRGHISCYSEPGRGTIFRVYLPVSPAGQEGASGELPTQINGPGGTETILLVDDEPALREIGAKMLARRGYHVTRAASGEEALEIFDADPSAIDLVILDVSMPGMGGHACLRKLREADPQVKVIIASGYSRETQLKEIAAVGASGYVAKPFRAYDLLTLVRQVLDEG
ncbi:PAS/PAC sensor hybrid histidine kinase [Desulfarculus baarsii DSM 2075]|uniref:histidine kinase n=1 Tax=Desulfarculus baarsii (strain ATCC 33931 / DSM 2075 / LMG 7858 / VKM B-1802 / 2st14) TaxID=644282 RepID=E1QKE9_DESB2|nr:PAS domain S-box protein [Desulfarculus baarsii]ADK86042.1 PAS/PAC sensor hybrid histidine kinase [Desulfarculus baarsii DSM 2075]